MADPRHATPTAAPGEEAAGPVPTPDPDAQWLREVYQPDEVNLTVRAVIAGMAIGAVMCLSNLYVFFKTGWSMGVTITACILAFAVFQVLQAARLARRPLGGAREQRPDDRGLGRRAT